jgi:hypothetical protein
MRKANLTWSIASDVALYGQTCIQPWLSWLENHVCIDGQTQVLVLKIFLSNFNPMKMTTRAGTKIQLFCFICVNIPFHWQIVMSKIAECTHVKGAHQGCMKGSSCFCSIDSYGTLRHDYGFYDGFFIHAIRRRVVSGKHSDNHFHSFVQYRDFGLRPCRLLMSIHIPQRRLQVLVAANP